MKKLDGLCLAALAAGALAVTSRPAIGQTAPTPHRAEVLVLGVYHMANPGHDLFNTKADDVLAPRRQAEMTKLLDVLKRFHPTKVAIEADLGSARVAREYGDYLAGKYTLTANEIDQIGYRLAKELGQPAIYPVDADGDFPWPRVVNYAKATGRSKELDAILADIGAMVKAQDQYLATHTILETLIDLNSDARVAQDVGFYYREARFGEPGDWAGPDLLAEWFRRNVRIFNNVAKLVETPDERVLVIFGSGHLGWLRQDVASDPTLRLRRLGEFAR